MKAEEAVEAFLGSCRGRGLSPQTISWYRTLLGAFARENPELAEDAVPIEVFLGGIPGSDETRHGYFRALRAFYAWAVRRRMVRINPMAEISAPRRRKKAPRSLTLAELGFLLTIPLCSRDRTLIMLLIDTGIRITEAITLTQEDIGEETIIVSGKTGQREVPISEEARGRLLELGGDGAIFLGEHGRPLTRSGAYQAVRRALVQAGISGKKLGPHTLRHTFGRQWILAGGDLVSLQRILGHAQISTTRIYADLDLRDILGQHDRFTPLKRAILTPQARLFSWSEGR